MYKELAATARELRDEDSLCSRLVACLHVHTVALTFTLAVGVVFVLGVGFRLFPGLGPLEQFALRDGEGGISANELMGVLFLLGVLPVLALRATGVLGLRASTAAAALLAWLGLEEVVGLHERVDVSVAADLRPYWLALSGAAAILIAVAVNGRAQLDRTRLLVAGGLAIWVAGEAVEDLGSGFAASAVGSLGQMGGEALTVVGLLALAQRTSGASELSRVSPGRTFGELVARLDVGRTALVLGAVILGLGVVASATDLRLFDMDREGTVVSYLSAAILLAVAGVALLLGRSGLADRQLARCSLAVAYALSFLALDEAFALHESLGDSTGLTGLGQVYFVPVVVVAGLSWVVVLGRLWAYQSARLLWLAGAACWVISQVLDLLQVGTARSLRDAVVVPEDLLEVTGSLLLGLGLILFVQQLLRAEAQRPRPDLVPEAVDAVRLVRFPLPAQHS